MYLRIDVCSHLQVRYGRTAKEAGPALSETERTCMVALYASDILGYKAELPKRADGTCSWILEHPQYVSWISEQRSKLLWITGYPGCGKTTISAYLADHLALVQRTELHGMVCYFFCDDKSAYQRDAKAILRGVIYQILQRRRRLIKHVKAAFDVQGSHLIDSFESLWNVFKEMVKDCNSGPVNILVDAIDECEEKTRIKFLDAITDFMQNANSDDDALPSSVKFVITSRPSLSIFYNFTNVWENRLPIEQDPSGVSMDVRVVIERRVREIVKRFNCSTRTKQFLEQALYSRADQTFLWVDFVLQRLEHSLLASAKDLQRILNTMPQELEVVYENFLRSIPSSEEGLAAKMLHVLVGSPRFLTLEEMNIILTIERHHQTVADIEIDLQPSISLTIQGILGPLVRISDSKVYLIHQSAKEFLLDLATRSGNPLALTYGVEPAKAALVLASSCVSYLQLQDFSEDKFSQEWAGSEDSTEPSPVFKKPDIRDEESAFDPLALEDYTIFKDQSSLDAEVCELLSTRYQLFDYAARYWAENFACCENLAPEQLREDIIQLTERSSCRLNNWLKYFWLQGGIEYTFPDDFDSLKVTSFFNQSRLLSHLLDERAITTTQLDIDRALFWAARRGWADTTDILLRNHAEPNSTVVDRQTPLNISAERGHLDVVKLLLADERTDVNLKGKSGRLPLSLASGNGHLPVVKLVINHALCLPDEADHNQWTPLFWAVGGNHLDVVSTLLNDVRVNINHTDRTGRSAFSWAAGEGFAGLLKHLMKDRRLNPNLHDSSGRTGLSWAAGNGHTDTVTTLLKDKRCDKSAKDTDLRNAISWACEGGHDKALKALIKYDCPGIDDEDVNGWTPLAWALKNRSPATVETLVSTRVVDIEHRDKTGRTALKLAAGYGYLDVVRFLLNEGADVDALDNEGRPPVDSAKAFGYTDIVRELESWRGGRM